jgi:hypothetical protein
VIRPSAVPTPCHDCPKIPDDALVKCRENAVEMSAQSWQIWTHYQECKAVGRFPDDPVVARHAGILRQMEDGFATSSVSGKLLMIIELLKGGMVR